MKNTPKDAPPPSQPAQISDDPETLATQAREGVEKSAAELRKHRVPISAEPPTVFRP